MATQFKTTGTQEGDIAAGLITGGVYNPNINVDQIGPASPVKLPDAPAATDYASIIAGLDATLPEETTFKKTQEDITTKTKELGGEAAFQAETEKGLGLDESKKELVDLTSQLRSVNTEAQIAAMNLDRRGDPTRLTAAHTLDVQNIEKDRTIKALRLSSSIQALQGNIALANDQAVRAVKLKYDPIKNELEVLNQQLDFNYKSFDLAERKRADKLKAANDIKIKELEIEQKGAESWVKEKNEALTNGASVNIVNKAEALREAGKENDARALLAPYTGDKLSSSESTAASLKNASTKLGGYLSARVGTDGYVSPEDYKKARSAWIADGYTTTDFDNRFGGFVNPGGAQDYGIKWKPSALSPQEQLLQQIIQQQQGGFPGGSNIG